MPTRRLSGLRLPDRSPSPHRTRGAVGHERLERLDLHPSVRDRLDGAPVADRRALGELAKRLTDSPAPGDNLACHLVAELLHAPPEIRNPLMTRLLRLSRRELQHVVQVSERIALAHGTTFGSIGLQRALALGRTDRQLIDLVGQEQRFERLDQNADRPIRDAALYGFLHLTPLRFSQLFPDVRKVAQTVAREELPGLYDSVERAPAYNRQTLRRLHGLGARGAVLAQQLHLPEGTLRARVRLAELLRLETLQGREVNALLQQVGSPDRAAGWEAMATLLAGVEAASVTPIVAQLLRLDDDTFERLTSCAPAMACEAGTLLLLQLVEDPGESWQLLTQSEAFDRMDLEPAQRLRILGALQEHDPQAREALIDTWMLEGDHAMEPAAQVRWVERAAAELEPWSAIELAPDAGGDAENVMAEERIADAAAGIDRLARVHVPSLGTALEELQTHLAERAAGAPEDSPLRRTRARATELQHAQRTLSGRTRARDLSGPITSNEEFSGGGATVRLGELCAQVWTAIHTEAREADRPMLREALLLALARCIEDDGHRVCGVGVSQRLVGVLRGHLEGLPAEVISPSMALCAMGQEILRAHGEQPAPEQLAEVWQRTVRAGRERYGEDSPMLKKLLDDGAVTMRSTYEWEPPAESLRVSWS
jgi:hypothetical protein